MKCRMAVFEEKTFTETPRGYGDYRVRTVTRRVPVECGGEIKEITSDPLNIFEPNRVIGYYCTRCGVRYEKLPEEQP